MYDYLSIYIEYQFKEISITEWITDDEWNSNIRIRTSSKLFQI